MPLQWAPVLALAAPPVRLHRDTATATAGDFRNGTDFHRVRVDTPDAVVFGNQSHRKEH